MLPKAILFDLDDTLFDHRRASAIALDAMHAAFAADLPREDFGQHHAEVLEIFHQRFLAGEFTLDQARVARMRALFAAFGREIDSTTADRAAALYRAQHQSNRHLVEGARELLDALAPHCRLGIVTNNSTAEQIEKLRALNIASYFDTIVISEDAGVTKPDPRIFAIALERIGAKPHETVFIGDSIANDIVGATSAGMAAVWLCRERETQELERLPGQKWPETRANAGVLPIGSVKITSLAPVAAAVAAIESAFQQISKTCTPGAEKHEQLETLAS
jgi:putative hydrolase of the HAD superfamily